MPFDIDPNNLTVFDIGAAILVILSILLAFARGFIREFFSLATWVGAAVVAYIAYPRLLEPIQNAVQIEIAAKVLAGAGPFLVALVVFKVLSAVIVGERSGFLDRLLGLIYGAARGVALVLIGYVGLGYVLEPAFPAWVENAESRPLIDTALDRVVSAYPSLEQFLPEMLQEEAGVMIEGTGSSEDAPRQPPLAPNNLDQPSQEDQDAAADVLRRLNEDNAAGQ